jgi:hypothetical protein
MALQGPISVEFGKVFPGGAYAAGPVEKVRDFERSRKDEVIQQLDKDSACRCGCAPSLPLALPRRRRQRRSAGAKGQACGPPVCPADLGSRSGIDKGTLAMAQLGLTWAGQEPARSPDSVRVIASYQIPPLRPHEERTMNDTATDA